YIFRPDPRFDRLARQLRLLDPPGFDYNTYVVVDKKVHTFIVKSSVECRDDPRKIFLSDDMLVIEPTDRYLGFDTGRLLRSKRKLKRYMRAAGLYELKPKHREWDAAMRALAKARL